MTVRAKDNTAIGHEIIANPFIHVRTGKGILVAELLNRQPIDAFLTKDSFVGRFPKEDEHCAYLAAETLQSALHDYMVNHRK